MTPDRSTTRFEEPALKAAVRRAWGHEAAPPTLRRNIEILLSNQDGAGESADVIRVAPSLWRRSVGFAMAAAAVVIVGIGIAFLQMNRPDSTSPAGPTLAAASLPAELAEQLIRRHDACCRLAPDDHHFFTAAPKDNFKAIAKGMSAELRHPVIAAAMGHEWDFRGAAFCPVGDMKTAHLMYARGDAFVSVFSLPASSLPTCREHENCDAAVEGHPVAGFVEQGGFYCVVASSGGQTPIDLEQVRALRDQLRQDVIASAQRQRERVATR